jgi:hypothetical protein
MLNGVELAVAPTGFGSRTQLVRRKERAISRAMMCDKSKPPIELK